MLRPCPRILAITLAGSALLIASAAEADRFPERPWGADSPASRCVVCHSLEKGGPFRVGPNLWGIVGAPKARDADWFNYSKALMEKGGTWTREEIDAYLAAPSQYAPGTTKTIHVTDPEERERIIDFLATLHD